MSRRVDQPTMYGLRSMWSGTITRALRCYQHLYKAGVCDCCPGQFDGSGATGNFDCLHKVRGVPVYTISTV